jgi:hypothetical protein
MLLTCLAACCRDRGEALSVGCDYVFVVFVPLYPFEQMLIVLQCFSFGTQRDAWVFGCEHEMRLFATGVWD